MNSVFGSNMLASRPAYPPGNVMPYASNLPLMSMPGNLPHTAARQPVANFAGMFPTITQPRLLNTLPAPAPNTNQPAGTTDKTDKTDKPVPIEKIIGITCAISIAATLIGIVVFYYAVIADTKVPSTTGATSSISLPVSQFTGATSVADGAIGYIPKPLAGQQNHVLTGDGSWQPVCPAFATYCSYAASGTNLLFTGANTNTLASRRINIDSGGTKIIPTVAGFYECRASWNSGGVSADSNINIAFNGGGFLTYGTSQVGVYQSGVVEAIILFNGTTDYIQITNRQWNLGQAQVNIKWFSS